MTPETTNADPERSSRNRVSIAERAARRERAEHAGRDRYDSLLRQLRAGREIPVTRRRAGRVEWHPVARWLLVTAALVAVAYLAISFVAATIRDNRVDTWAGPTGDVTSGQKLATCPLVPRRNDAMFPTWIRYDGGLFIQADAALPLGATNIGKYYLDSGYTNNALRIYDVVVGGMGQRGSHILVRAGEAPAAELYRRLEGCS